MAFSDSLNQRLAIALRDQGAANELESAIETAQSDVATLQTLVSGIAAAELGFLDAVVAGTGAASKALVLDSGEDATWPATGILTYGVLKDPAGSTLLATVAELNRAAD